MRVERQRTSRRGPRRRFSQGPLDGPLYAALDLGTNSCRMLIARPTGEHFEIVDAFSKSVKLGKDLERTERLSEDGIRRTITALQVCASKIRKHKVRRMRLVATEACRRARNGERFLAEVKRQTGLELEIIDPSEEARLAVVSCAPLVKREAHQILVIDIGGGSTELVWLDVSEVAPEERAHALTTLPKVRTGVSEVMQRGGAEVVDWISVPLGVATLHERYLDVRDVRSRFALMSCHFEDAMEEFTPYIDADEPNFLHDFQMIGTSGTVTTVGAAHLGLTRYDRTKVDGLTLSDAEINAVIESFLSADFRGRIGQLGIGLDRADLVLAGAAILQTLLRIWPTNSLSVADRGLREGMLYSMMGADGVLLPEPV